jgi:hypothetical protein
VKISLSGNFDMITTYEQDHIFLERRNSRTMACEIYSNIWHCRNYQVQPGVCVGTLRTLTGRMEWSEVQQRVHKGPQRWQDKIAHARKSSVPASTWMYLTKLERGNTHRLAPVPESCGLGLLITPNLPLTLLDLVFIILRHWHVSTSVQVRASGKCLRVVLAF